MPCCRICGETKKPDDFVKLKHFYKYHPSDVEWCKDCQKMYMEMKKEVKRKEEFLALPFVAKVEFN